MSARKRPLILALADVGLRSLLATYLTLNGEMPIVSADHRDPALSEALRRAAILVIEEQLIAATPLEWAETLRNQCWCGELIIIVDFMPDGIRESEGIALIDRSRAFWAVPEVLRHWRSQPPIRSLGGDEARSEGNA
jgi:hypothetical protein